MKKLVYVAFVAAMAMAFGCAITNYPVMFDTRGADDNQIVDSFYDKAYIIPSGQIATIYDDGSDELFTEVAQSWRGDQTLYTFNNFDPTGLISFLDQTYCDPTRADNCAAVVADNPDLPEAYTFGSGPLNEQDDPFDYTLNAECSGARSVSLLLSVGSRIGECGSGIWANKQDAAAEFAALDVTTYQGREFFSLPMDGRNTSITINSHMTGASSAMPVFGRFQSYIDNDLRVVVPVTPNFKYQAKWLANWVASQGTSNQLEVVYNGLTTTFDVNAALTNVDRF
ncbi:MAG: hypothetical protein HC882_04100 [Acidobacteria bacterium]|nr:hypothetical protein [Acidobacteriota bacterium]